MCLQIVTFIKYYADVDADGDVDGIIFADLAFSNSGQWTDGNWKEYFVVQHSDFYFFYFWFLPVNFVCSTVSLN